MNDPGTDAPAANRNHETIAALTNLVVGNVSSVGPHDSIEESLV